MTAVFRDEVAIVHDYLTQRGGAERVVLELARAFPQAPIYTSLFDPASTFPEFRTLDVRASWLNAVGVVRRHHRLGLLLLAPTFDRLRVDARLAICSSSGWAHGADVSGRKVVYCHAPARWLYQSNPFSARRLSLARLAAAAVRRPLVRWDRRAAASAARYVVNSSAVRAEVLRLYGIEAEVVPPPPALVPGPPSGPVEGVGFGYFLCVSRLLPYKNVARVVDAFRALPDERLVIVGDGPQLSSLRDAAPENVSLLGSVPDERLRALYEHCVGLVAPAFEDYGLTPLEAAAFGKPTAALRFGGYLDTVLEGETGVFFDAPEPERIRDGVRALKARSWDRAALRHHAEAFSQTTFAARMQALVAESLAA